MQAGIRRAWIVTLIVLWAALCIAHWVSCRRHQRELSEIEPIPVIVDTPRSEQTADEAIASRLHVEEDPGRRLRIDPGTTVTVVTPPRMPSLHQALSTDLGTYASE